MYVRHSTPAKIIDKKLEALNFIKYEEVPDTHMSAILRVLGQVHTISVAQDMTTTTWYWNLAVHKPSTDVVLTLCLQLLDRTLKDALDRSKPVCVFLITPELA